jgi:hypothetical protein
MAAAQRPFPKLILPKLKCHERSTSGGPSGNSSNPNASTNTNPNASTNSNRIS